MENDDMIEKTKKMVEIGENLAKLVGDKHQQFVAHIQLFLIKCNENVYKIDEISLKDFSACENILKQLEQAYEDIINEG